MLSSPCIVERPSRLQSALSLGIAEHVHGNALGDVRAGADAIYRLLHLPVAAIASFDGVGCCRQQRIVQEGHRLFQRGREQLIERLAKALEATDALAKSGQLGQGRVGSAATVKQAVGLIDDLPQRPKVWLAPRDPQQRLSFGRCQVVLDEQMAVVKQVRDLLFDAFLAGSQLAVGPRGSAPADLGQRAFELSSDLGHGLQDGLVEFGQDMELTDLMTDRAKHLGDGRRVQRRTVGGDAVQAQPTGFQDFLEPHEELGDVFLGGIMVENLIDQALEPMVVHDRQDAVRPVVQFVGGDIAGEVGQGAVQVVIRDAISGPFSPPASTQFWTVANGTKTRWSRHKCQEAERYGSPSSTTSRTAKATTRRV